MAMTHLEGGNAFTCLRDLVIVGVEQLLQRARAVTLTEQAPTVFERVEASGLRDKYRETAVRKCFPLQVQSGC